MSEVATNNIAVTVLYFAGAQTATGLDTESVSLPVTTAGSAPDNKPGFPLSNLAAELVARYPGKKGENLKSVLESSKWAVNAEMVDDTNTVFLKGGEEVAVIPPVSAMYIHRRFVPTVSETDQKAYLIVLYPLPPSDVNTPAFVAPALSRSFLIYLKRLFPMNTWAHRLLPTTCFTASRLTATTFKIVEDDRFQEQPFIYIKIYPSVVLLVDTGCGGAARDPTVQLRSLRQFIERFPIVDNGSRPLNEGGLKPYVVVQTHLHYDHICGMEQFIGSTIVASNYSKLFVTCDLPTHSLCRFLGITTPKYDITQWASDCEFLFSRDDLNLQMQVLHTPGHTPDSLALWDEDEKVLFVGDTLYEWAPTIFPNEGHIVDWLGSMDKLRAFVKEKISIMTVPQPIFINCGHVTACGPALEILEQMHDFMERILSRKVPITHETIKRDERFVTYGKQGQDRFVVACPERLVQEAREQLDI